MIQIGSDWLNKIIETNLQTYEVFSYLLYIMLWMDKKTGEKLADNRQDWK